jgi:hypothetical protein
LCGAARDEPHQEGADHRGDGDPQAAQHGDQRVQRLAEGLDVVGQFGEVALHPVRDHHIGVAGLAVVVQVLEAADDLFVVGRLPDHRHSGLAQLGGEGGDREGGVALVARALREVRGVLPRLRGGDL